MKKESAARLTRLSLSLVTTYLVLAWSAVILVDLLNVFDSAGLPAWELAFGREAGAIERNTDWYWTPGFQWIDTLLEESLELIAAALLASGLALLAAELRRSAPI